MRPDDTLTPVTNAAMIRAIDVPDSAWVVDTYTCRQLERKVAALQAKIDELMLEYCPDEMTPEQLSEWERNQVHGYI